MTVAVAIACTSKESICQQWDFALCHFSPDVIYVVGGEVGDGSMAKAIPIKSAEDIPLSSRLVVMAPQNGANVQGDQSLSDFDHPSGDVVYWFGSDSHHIDDELFSVRKPDACVYVPTDTPDQMYSFQCWVVTAWDRRMKEQ